MSNFMQKYVTYSSNCQHLFYEIRRSNANNYKNHKNLICRFHGLSAILAHFSRRLNDFPGFRASNSRLLTGGGGALIRVRTANCPFDAHSGSKHAFTFWHCRESQPQN